MKFIVTGIVLLCLFTLGLAFSAQNELLVKINYFVAQGEFQVAHLMAGSFLVGVILSLAVTLFLYFKLRIKNSRLRVRIRQLQKKLSKPAAETAKAGALSTMPPALAED